MAIVLYRMRGDKIDLVHQRRISRIPDAEDESRRKVTRGYLPTQSEIAAACKRIRAGWTDGERNRRAGEQIDSLWQEAEHVTDRD